MVKKKPGDGDYDVGFGKPPKSGQFRPGKSGNKKGRPKGAKNFKTDLKDVLGETIPVTMNGKTKRITKQKAMLLTTVAKAVKGDIKATNTVIGMVLKLLPEELDAAEIEQLTETDKEILEQFALDVLKNAAMNKKGSKQ
ncbi:MAG: DUF5681 domain-containing protein [Parvibaculum sp.]